MKRLINLNTELLKNDPVNKVILDFFCNAYLVGGYLRDFLLSRPSVDRDFIITEKSDINKLRDIAIRLDGKLILIKDLARIILSNGKEVDITFTEDPIIEDLKKRDFTINAIAWSDMDGLIDPFNGINDLKRGYIRALSEDNIRKDPLRILRAYRIAGELKFKIDYKTRNYIKKLKRYIKYVSKERVTKEFFKILNLPDSDRIIKMLIDDGVLEIILNIRKKRTMENYAMYRKLNSFIKRSKYRLDEEISQSLNHRGFLNLAVISYGFNPESSLLRLSRKISNRLESIHNILKKLKKIKKRIRRENLFDYFMEIKEYPDDIGFIVCNRRILKEAERFQKTIENPVIRGNELSFISGLKGKDLGELYKYILREQFLGKFDNSRKKFYTTQIKYILREQFLGKFDNSRKKFYTTQIKDILMKGGEFR